MASSASAVLEGSGTRYAAAASAINHEHLEEEAPGRNEPGVVAHENYGECGAEHDLRKKGCYGCSSGRGNEGPRRKAERVEKRSSASPVASA